MGYKEFCVGGSKQNVLNTKCSTVPIILSTYRTGNQLTVLYWVAKKSLNDI